MKSYLYTGTKLPTSTCQRKLVSETLPAEIASPHPFTIWTDDNLEMAAVYPPRTIYSTVWRSPNNRAARRAAKLNLVATS